VRVAVIVVWRPKGQPNWRGRSRPGGTNVAAAMAYDRNASPYVGIHLTSLLPRHWEITLVHEQVRDADLEQPLDAVFLSTMDYCAPHARWLAREYRSRGVKVVVGGLYPTLNPGYFAQVADAVVVGEAESVMPALARDLERGKLEPIYRTRGPADLSELPPPRYDLVETDFHVPMSYEATRGCPFTCSFCVLSALPSPYRRRPIANVIRDIGQAPAHWNWTQRKNLVLWDNNLGADREYCRALCEALVPLKRWWGTQTSIDTITRESARLLGRAGCRVAYIGLESLSQGSLTASNKRHNNVQKYREKIGYLHENGVLVMSFFLLGLDGDTLEYAGELPNLIEEVGVDIPVFSYPAPIEGTPFRKKLEEEGRLLGGDLNSGMDGSYLLFRPRGVAPEELELAFYTCMRRTWSLPRVARRVWQHVRSRPSTLLMSAFTNAHYTAYEHAVARRGMARLRERGPWPDHLPAMSREPMPALAGLVLPS
jgi:radical SAM superfamily enzyme YgiQ (UPF0313 family)